MRRIVFLFFLILFPKTFYGQETPYISSMSISDFKIGDIISAPSHCLGNKGIYIDPLSILPYFLVENDGIFYTVAYRPVEYSFDEADTRFPSVIQVAYIGVLENFGNQQESFLTPEKVHIKMTYKELKKMKLINQKPQYIMGLGYCIKFRSGWIALFETEKFPRNKDYISVLFKSEKEF